MNRSPKTKRIVPMAFFFWLILWVAAAASFATSLPQVQIPPEGRFAAVNGMRMYYEEYGQGEPLVLLHGFFGSSGAWKPVIPEFAKHYRLVVPDLRGHGRTNNPTEEFTHRQSALDVFGLLDRLGIPTARAMGISTGGMTLIHMATREPSRLEAVVLIGATIYFPDEARAIMTRSTSSR